MHAAVEFRPPLWLRSGHLQTFWSNYVPRPGARGLLALPARVQLLETPDGDRIRLHWNEPARVRGTRASSAAPASPAAARPADTPVLILLHGLTGCATSPNVTGLAAAGLARGFRTVRVDLRNAMGDAPSHGVGHAGRSEDLRLVLEQVRAQAPGVPVAVIGISLGGNVAVKTAGELGAERGHAPAVADLRAVVAISAPLDLDLACRAIDARRNTLYRAYFLRRLRRIVRQRHARRPELYPNVPLPRVRSLRRFDDLVVAPACGFRDAGDYYARCSGVRFAPTIRVPTLLIHAEDDPFVPTAPLEEPRVRDNPKIAVLRTRRGGHVGFYAGDVRGAARWWAERRALDFCARALR